MKEEVPAGWTGRARAAIDEVRRRLPDLDHLIRRNEIFLARTVGVGVLSAAQAAAFGASGPVARASGLDFDLRRDEPYLAYGELDVPVVTRTTGDCHARFEVLLDQVYASLDLAASLPGPGGPDLRPGQRTAAQGGQGARGAHLRVDREPARHQRLLPGVPGREDAVADEAAHRVVRQRAGAQPRCIPGCLVPDLIAILGSMFFVVGDIDK